MKLDRKVIFECYVYFSGNIFIGMFTLPNVLESKPEHRNKRIKFQHVTDLTILPYK